MRPTAIRIMLMSWGFCRFLHNFYDVYVSTMIYKKAYMACALNLSSYDHCLGAPRTEIFPEYELIFSDELQAIT